MDKRVELLANGLRLAEQSHAAAEKAGHVGEWPEFYAQWLLDNMHVWAPFDHECEDGSCEVHNA